MHRRFSARNEDAGFTLVEVVVAMIVFAVIATGFLYVLTSAMTMSRDTRARIVAANLASQQIDLIRSAKTVFDVKNETRTATLNGDRFEIATSWSWATSTGATVTCEAGAASGSFSYKKVTVEVTWDNMSGRPVYSDTAYTPRAKINDPTKGTVLVGVIDAYGEGVSGATVTLDPSPGIDAVTTDSDGCAYLLKVPEGEYDVIVNKSGFINQAQLTAPKAGVSVTAGGSSRVSFAYDRAATFRLTFAGGTTPVPSLPTNLSATFLSTYGAFPVTLSKPAGVVPVSRFPVASGYSIVAGTYVEAPDSPATSCLAPDPGRWVADATKFGVRPDPVAAAPAGTVSASVAMGTVKLASIAGTGKYLTAVYVGGGPGDPGCAAVTTSGTKTPDLLTYTFADIVVSNGATIALPYGTWNIYRGASSGAKSTLLTSGVTVLNGGEVSGARVTLDPRVAG
ncbi:carboxypeptidase regulatory-like domain-containing protein [Microbacterium sp. bgisy203]|uniref:carboxypeptidase regulatory-like domain-containing protein n=1 Tax=Microbacterium sp. bgisy203 TaxID=3413799 RepID=UPI003D71818F